MKEMLPKSVSGMGVKSTTGKHTGVCAVIPAKDAAGLIGECIAAALPETDHVIVVCDRCVDETETVARSAGAQTVIVKQSWPHPDTHLGHRVADALNAGLAAVPHPPPQPRLRIVSGC